MEDAGVHPLGPYGRPGEDTVLVQTVDFITPVLDDPYSFGQAAAANALSDIYAMGARPVTALNLVAFPPLPDPSRRSAPDHSGSRGHPVSPGPEVLAAILRGGLDKVTEAGATLLGGHSVVDPELKYGLAVTGLAGRSELLLQSAGRPGDALFLTKPIGGGLLSGTLKREGLAPKALDDLTRVVTALNAFGRDAAHAAGARAATDVTGFGLLGHLANLAIASGVGAEVEAGLVPVIPAARDIAVREGPGVFPGGARRNLDFVAGRLALAFDKAVEPWRRLLLADPVTSGGLLVAVPPAGVETFTRTVSEALSSDPRRGYWCSRVGRLTDEAGTIRVTGP